jgi:hypothetical protein
LQQLTKILKIYENQLKLAKQDFADIVESGTIMRTPSGEPWKLRIFFYNETFLDVHLSITGKYSYHWDLRVKENKIYRHDNAPHERWRDIPTFPKHFHNGSEKKVSESPISSKPEKAIREFLEFIRSKLLMG